MKKMKGVFKAIIGLLGFIAIIFIGMAIYSQFSFESVPPFNIIEIWIKNWKTGHCIDRTPFFYFLPKFSDSSASMKDQWFSLESS